MAYTAGNLHLRAGAPGDLTYTYDAAADTLSTVLVAGYFNNDDDNLNLTVDDLIFVQATDGNMWLRVSAISSGSVTTQFAGGNLPVQVPGTGTVDEKISSFMSMGHYEIGSAISTATRYILPAPYPGAEVLVRREGSALGSVIMVVDAGGSLGFPAAGGGATNVTFDNAGSRRFGLKYEGEYFHVVGVSTTRWRILTSYFRSCVSGCASAESGASRFPGGTADI